MKSPKLDPDGELPYNFPTADDTKPTRGAYFAAGTMIVAIGIVIFLIVYRQQSQAEQTACSGNLHEIGLALMQYAEDNDETIPNRLQNWPGSTHATEQQEQYTWRWALSPYLKDDRAMKCLANPNRDVPTGCVLPICGPEQYTDGYTTSYACNYNSDTGGSDRGNGYCGGKGSPPVRLPDIIAPSQLISIVEVVSPWSEFNVLKPTFTNQLFTGHGGQSNYLFADGHVSSMTPQDSLGPTNYWSRDNIPFSGNNLTIADSVLRIK